MKLCAQLRNLYNKVMMSRPSLDELESNGKKNQKTRFDILKTLKKYDSEA